VAILVACASIDGAGAFATEALARAGVARAAVLLAGTIVPYMLSIHDEVGIPGEVCDGKVGGMTPCLDLPMPMNDSDVNEKSSFLLCVERLILDTSSSAS
jgi:hypothetical protein